MEQFTAFDIAVLAAILLSTLFAFGRGFVTVALSFGAWLAAFLITAFGFEYIQPYWHAWVSPKELADLLALAVTFVALLVGFKMLANYIGDNVKESAIGFLDRSLGALFGFARGIVVVSIGYIGFTTFYPGEEQPDWVANARLRPLVAWGAEMVEGFASDVIDNSNVDTSNAEDIIAGTRSAVKSQFIADELEKRTATYGEKARDELDALIGDIQDEDVQDKTSKPSQQDNDKP